MALVRCSEHGKPDSRTRTYVMSVQPVGYPDTAAICGLAGCRNAGLVWLDVEDAAAYAEGERIIPVPNSAIKVKVQ